MARKRKITLRQARLLKGLYLREVDIGVHWQTIRNYELGITKPNDKVLQKLCDVYGVTPNDIII